jgi:hypothetical protein
MNLTNPKAHPARILAHLASEAPTKRLLQLARASAWTSPCPAPNHAVAQPQPSNNLRDSEFFQGPRPGCHTGPLGLSINWEA